MTELQRKAINEALILIRRAYDKADCTKKEYVGAQSDLREAEEWLKALLEKVS